MTRKEARALQTDHEIMLAVREGDLDGMSILFRRHGGHLFNFFLRMTGRRQDSEDLVQEVFLRMLRYRLNYRDDSRFETWMFQIARSARIDAWRKSRPGAPLPEDGVLSDPSPGPEDILIRKTESETIHRALALLSDDKREVLLLSRFENLGFREIARILGARETTVKVRAHRAVRELGTIVQRLNGEKQT
jgi:RNA polymerase sigma factor (sigma-70 family)